MIIAYRKRFLKELARIPAETRQKIENFVFEVIPKVDSIHEVGIVEQKKMGLPIKASAL